LAIDVRQFPRGNKVKQVLIVFMFGLLLCSEAASAKGCIKGAAVGAVAGHVAGHHAVAGAVAGCVVGHAIAKKQEQDKKAAAKLQNAPPAPAR
jgi:hypothetical protein